MYLDGGTRTHGALDVQPAAVKLHKSLGQRQSDPGTVRFACQRTIDLSKRREGLGNRLAWYPDTGITDLNRNPAMLVEGGYRNPATGPACI